MRDLLKALVYIAIVLSPAVVATRCASERRRKRRSDPPYTGPERRDPR